MAGGGRQPGLAAVIRASCWMAVIATTATAQPSVPPASAARPLVPADVEAWLDSVVPPALQAGDIAGLVISVVANGQVLLEKGYGSADLARRTPMDPRRTVLLAASVSKAFTATAVMQLVERGVVDLDRNVNDYLDFPIPATFAEPVTLRQLLTHTAGFEEIAYRRYRPPRSLRDHVRKVPERIYPPGTIPAYSNYGLNLAGYIVERASGQPVADYIEHLVLAPLGMEHSSFRMALPDSLKALAASYYATASGGEPYPPGLVAELSPVESPSSGLATTGHDMTRFMLMHLQDGRHEDRQLLSPQTVQRMHAPAFMPMPGAQPVALGLFRTDYRGHLVLGHSGDGEGAHAEMKLLPDLGIGFFTAVNSDGAAPRFLPAAFTLRTELFESFVDRYFPAPAPAPQPAALADPAHARLAAGEYVWSRRQVGDYQEALSLLGRFALDMVIRANPDGTITTSPAVAFEESGRAQTWREVSPFVWREVGGDAHLLMNVRAGRVQSVWSDQVASFWVALPVPFLMSARLNVPALGLATGVLIVTVLAWPVTALLRRRRTGAVAPRARRVVALSRLAALLGVLYMAGWAWVLIADLPSWENGEPWIRLLQLLGLICVAGAGVACWNAWLTWRGPRGAVARVSSGAIAVALLYLGWFSFAFHLISIRID